MTAMDSKASGVNRNARVPSELQAVFLAFNQGIEVKPPSIQTKQPVAKQQTPGGMKKTDKRVGVGVGFRSFSTGKQQATYGWVEDKATFCWQFNEKAFRERGKPCPFVLWNPVLFSPASLGTIVCTISNLIHPLRFLLVLDDNKN